LGDLGNHDTDEPFERLLTLGMVLRDGAKMSNSKGYTVDPDELVQRYGADTARLFTLFAAPPQKELEWNDSGVEGAFRFVKKLTDRADKVTHRTLPEIDHSALDDAAKTARAKVYEALRKSSDVYEKTFAFNTLIAACMEALNALDKQENEAVWSEGMYIILHLLEPIIPHVASELSAQLFDRANLSDSIAVREEVFVQDSVTLAVTINGKRRTEITVPADTDKEAILDTAKTAATKWLEDKTIVKEIVVPGKLVNLVVK
jgi:leucyl-tRNA synthetase